MKEFFECARAIAKVKLPTGTIGVSEYPAGVMAVHMKESAMLEHFRPEVLVREDRMCSKYPYEYYATVLGVKFFFITAKELPTDTHWDELAIEYGDAQLES